MEVQRIAGLRASDGRLLRCDGTWEELDTYRGGMHEMGWSIQAVVEVGDLLLSCVGTGRARMIVSLCRVEEVAADGSAFWDEGTDVSINPAVLWNAVADRTGDARARPSSEISTPDARAFLKALAAEVRSQTDVPEVEGQIERRSCRRRSNALRRRALEQANGLCAGCDLDLRALFGERGDRGLEVHHKVPLSKLKNAEQETRLKDLLVLCATCHRLIHADPELSLDRLRVGWSGVLR